MKRALAVTLGGCAVLAAFALPPQPRIDPESHPPTPQEVRAQALGLELAAANETARRLQWVDSLLPLVRDAAKRDLPFAVGILPGLADQWGNPDGGQAQVVGEVARETTQRGVTRPAVDLGVFLVDGRTDFVSERVAYVPNRYEWYAGARDGRAYCMSVRTTSQPSTDDLGSRRWGDVFLFDPSSRTGVDIPPDILGPCRVYARHGMPGREIGRWMLRSGATKAVERSDVPIPPVRGPVESRGWVFRRHQVAPSDVAFEGCRSGSAAACDALIFANIKVPGDLVEQSIPVMQAGGVPLLEARGIFVPPRSIGEVASDRVLDALERSFGEAAFDRFWHSPKPVEEAFVDAFGVTPARWGRDWTRSLGPAENAAILPAATDAPLLLLYLGAALAIAFGLARRGRPA
jgi:hypothetical protein